MSDKTDATEPNEGRDGALAALIDVVEHGQIAREFPLVSASFNDDDYSDLIRLAWRHQFDDDRSRFKRDVRELEAQVRKRIMDRLELGG